MSWPFGWKAALGHGVALVVPALAAGWALDAGTWWLAVIAGGLAVFVYWRATAIYRTWAIGGPAPPSGAQLGVCAGIGVLACIGGAVLLELASDHDNRSVAAVGIVLVVAGLMPIMHAIRYEPPSVGPRPWPDIAFGWELNALFAFAALSPGLLILGAPVLVAALVPSFWLASVAVNRLSRFGWYRHGATVVFTILAVGTGIWFMSVPDPGDDVALSIGLLLACLGCIDALSAPVRRRARVDWSPNRKAAAVALAAAAVLIAAVTKVSVLEHVPLALATVVVVFCFGFGGSYIRRGQGLVVLALLAALTLWVIADRDDGAPADPAPDGRRTVVALGDSYASGEGATTFLPGTNVQDGNHCRRSSDAYGYQVARALDSHLEFVACSGAIATQVWKTGQVPRGAAGDDVGTLPQIDNRVGARPDLVLISIGGNDALFGAVGRGCALPGSCTDIKDIFDGNLGQVRESVTTALRRVSARFPQSPILVVPYPQMLPAPPGPGGARGDCDGVPLGRAELDYLHGFVDALDTQVERAVADANDAPTSAENIAYFEPGEDAYAGHRVCGLGNGDSAVNTLAIAPTEATSLFDRLVPTSWTHNSFHPKRLGHDLLTAALVEWIREHVPGFGSATRFPVTRHAAPTPPPREAGTCPDREACTQQVNAWSTGKTIEAIRSVFPYAVLLGALGWALAAVRRLAT